MTLIEAHSLQHQFRQAKARSLRLLRKDSAHTDWMNECVPELMDAGKEQDVAVAACLNIWRDAWEESHPDGAVDPGPPRPEDEEDKALFARARTLLKEWDESKHPRVPAGSPDGGQFGSGGGGAASDKPKKGKGKAKKEDFDKAKIKISVLGSSSSKAEAEFVETWNEKVGIEPEEFKKTFLGGTNASMEITGRPGSGKFDIQGSIWGDEEGVSVGEYQREIDVDKHSAYSAYFKLNRSSTKHNIGKQVLGGNIETYRQMGVETVGVTANIDVGGYAWAKYGYIPTQSAWNELRGKLMKQLGGDTSRVSSSNTMEAESWDMLPSSVQDDVRDRWMRDSYDEFLASEEQNYRDSGQALEDSKNRLVDRYNEGSIPQWFTEAIGEVRDAREENGEAPIPYTDEQLFSAISLDYQSRYGDGRDDPEVTFDDGKLQEPQGYDPAQGTLPGIEPEDPAKRLTDDMREAIEKATVEGFNNRAESDALDIDPPAYLGDSVREYQEEYWDQKDDDEKLREAINYGMADIELPPDDDEEPQHEMDLPQTDEDELLTAAKSSDPKSIWKIADSPRGKELLLKTTWSGVLNLKDKEQMARFDKYVGKAA